MVLLEVRNFTWSLLSSSHQSFKECLVVLRPFANRKLRNKQSSFVGTFNLSLHDVASLSLASFGGDLSCVAGEVWMHNLCLVAVDHSAKIGNDLTRVMVLNSRRVSSTNTIWSIDENHGNNGHVVLRFNRQTIIIQVVQECIVIGMEDGARNLLESREDVTSRGMILTTHATSTKLTSGVEKVNIVRSGVWLGHSNDGTIQRHFTVVIGRVLSNVT